MQWEAAPSSLPGGAEMAVLVRRSKPRRRLRRQDQGAKGYRVPPHTHPKAELVTIISGAFSFGRGQAADHARVEKLPAGSFISMPAGVLHYVFVDEDSVLQINATGPWQIDYYDPKDDPRLILRLRERQAVERRSKKRLAPLHPRSRAVCRARPAAFAYRVKVGAPD